jgi:hypothetical protein
VTWRWTVTLSRSWVAGGWGRRGRASDDGEELTVVGCAVEEACCGEDGEERRSHQVRGGRRGTGRKVAFTRDRSHLMVAVCHTHFYHLV